MKLEITNMKELDDILLGPLVRSNPRYLFSLLVKPLETDMHGQSMNFETSVIPSGNTFKQV